MRALLDEARSLYDRVIVDSPPVLAVTDPAVVASLVDGTILVVRVGATGRDAVRRAVAQLQGVHARLLGVVVNAVARRQAGSGAYDGYYVTRGTRSRTAGARGLPTR
jgi:Mrp family chromosome partitioning ATPase